MLYKIKLIVASALCISVFFIGCSPNDRLGVEEDYERIHERLLKEGKIETHEGPVVVTEDGTEILYFLSFRHFISFCNYDDEQLAEFSRKNHYRFKSFAEISEAIYDSLAFENCKSEEEVFALVEKNKDYIEIITDENGEQHILPKLLYSPYRKFINKNRIFLIDDMMYKVYDDATLYTPKKNSRELKDLENTDIIPKGIEVFYSSKNMKNTCTDCPIYTFNPEDIIKPGTETKTKAAIARTANCKYREWLAEHPFFPDYIGCLGYGGTSRTWIKPDAKGKNRIELRFEIRIEQLGSNWRVVPQMVVVTKKKFLGKWKTEKHTMSLRANFEVWIDYSGMITGNGHPIMDYLPFSYENIDHQGSHTLSVPLSSTLQSMKYYNAGTMNYKFWAKSQAMPNEWIDVEFTSNELHFSCIE